MLRVTVGGPYQPPPPRGSRKVVEEGRKNVRAAEWEGALCKAVFWT